MPRKLPSSGFIQFGKQLDIFEDAIKDVVSATLMNDSLSMKEAHEEKDKHRARVIDLYEKKGK